ncbi:Hypothetical predicted protein [Olea europaea subsp. europaea]|uniref:Uncharacterized protein n=1 Tax=Olea europaea subsp. europaea TaxID=158383 RepID=A0A8S0U2W9_OLEEU|nr:Hypothetical predicted protein [Olea europaea subsp. europaea]
MPPRALLHWQRTDAVKPDRAEVVSSKHGALGRQGFILGRQENIWKARIFSWKASGNLEGKNYSWKARCNLDWLAWHFVRPGGERSDPGQLEAHPAINRTV